MTQRWPLLSRYLDLPKQHEGDRELGSAKQGCCS